MKKRSGGNKSSPQEHIGASNNLKPVHVRNKNKTNRWMRILNYSLLACVSFFLLFLFLSPQNLHWKDVVQSMLSGSSITTDAPNTVKINKNSIPTASEYRQLAQTNGWYPIDPLDKLRDTISKMPQVFDLEGTVTNKDADSLLQMLHEEVVFLLKVMARSSNETFDLTPALFDSLEAMHLSLYRVMKKKLQTNEFAVISKAQVEQMTRRWLGNHMRELLKIVIQNRKDKSLNHMKIDMRGTHSSSGWDLLTKTVQLRLYSVISAFATFAFDFKDNSQNATVAVEQWTNPFLMAVRNADDLSLALLLQVTSQLRPFHNNNNDDNAESVVECTAVSKACREAQDLHYDTLARRLQQHLARRFCHKHIREELSLCQGVSLSEWMTQNPNWNQSLELLPVSFPLKSEKRPSDDNDEGRVSTVSRQCDIPVLTVAELLSPADETVSPATRFERDFVQRNKPVLIQVFSPKNDRNTETATLWHELQKTFHNVFQQPQQHAKKSKLKVAAIPYAPLFGHSEIETSSQEFSDAYLPSIAHLTATQRSLIIQNLGLTDSIQNETLDHADEKVNEMKKTVRDWVETVKRQVEAFHYSASLAAHDPNITQNLPDIPETLLLKLAAERDTPRHSRSVRHGRDTQLTENWPLYFFGAATHVEDTAEGVNEAVRDTVKGDDNMIKERLLPAVLQFLKHFEADSLEQNVYNNSSDSSVDSGDSHEQHVHGTLWDLIRSVSSPTDPVSVSQTHRDTLKSHYRLQAFHGPVFSGAPTHSHSPAFNLAVKGRKLWTLLPPAADLYSTVHPLDTLPFYLSSQNNTDSVLAQTEDPDTQKLGEHLSNVGCVAVQETGHMLYVPRHVSHSVLNLDSVNSGFALEVEQYIY